MENVTLFFLTPLENKIDYTLLTATDVFNVPQPCKPMSSPITSPIYASPLKLKKRQLEFSQLQASPNTKKRFILGESNSTNIMNTSPISFGYSLPLATPFQEITITKKPSSYKCLFQQHLKKEVLDKGLYSVEIQQVNGKWNGTVELVQNGNIKYFDIVKTC